MMSTRSTESAQKPVTTAATGQVRSVALTHLATDPRFSYALLLPAMMDEQTRLLVSVHGSDRDPSHSLEAFRDLAMWHNAAILAPLFPRHPEDDGDVLGYKMLRWDGVNYDELLLQMVDDAHTRFATPAGRFLLSGYSGGGQFVERFTLFRADTLLAASIGAPGRVTLPDLELPWWIGLQGAKERIGLEPNFDALRSIPVQVVVGNVDVTDANEIRRDSELWMENSQVAGATRLERSTTLYRSLVELGVDARLDVMEGQAHDPGVAHVLIKMFLVHHLANGR